MNIFVCEGEIVKVGDLGIAKILKDGAARTQIGTPHYMPPEVSRGGLNLQRLQRVLARGAALLVEFTRRAVLPLCTSHSTHKFKSSR